MANGRSVGVTASVESSEDDHALAMLYAHTRRFPHDTVDGETVIIDSARGCLFLLTGSGRCRGDLLLEPPTAAGHAPRGAAADACSRQCGDHRHECAAGADGGSRPLRRCARHQGGREQGHRVPPRGDGGIIHYRNTYPDDAHLRLWSGLVTRHRTGPDAGLDHLEAAAAGGVPRWRIAPTPPCASE